MAHIKPEMQTAHEIGILAVALKSHGSRNPSSGKIECPYGVVFDKTQHTLEALNGTLRAAKRQKKITFTGELLMMPKDKDVPIVLLDEGEGEEEERKVQETLP
ncbi:hypothetical protein JCM10296v2_005431 [Rhodotorula toruloides]